MQNKQGYILIEKKEISTLNKLRFLLSKEEKKQWILVVSFGFIMAGMEIMTALSIAIFAQILMEQQLFSKYFFWLGMERESDAHKILAAASCIFIIYTVKNALALLESWFQNRAIQNMNYGVRTRLLTHYLEWDYEFMLKRNSSTGYNVIANDVEAVCVNGMMALSMVVGEFLVIVVLCAAVAYSKPDLFFVLVVFIGTLLILAKRIMFPLFFKWGERMRTVSWGSHHYLLQVFHAFKEIILYDKFQAFSAHFKSFTKERGKIQSLQNILTITPRLFLEVAFMGGFVIAIGYMCAKHTDKSMIFGILGGYLYVGFRLMPSLNRIISQSGILRGAMPSIEKIYEEMHKGSKQVAIQSCAELHFEKCINIRNVSFHYEQSKKMILQKINLEIRRGENIGFVGKTGSGKSTLLDLILGLLKPTSGAIEIDSKYSVSTKEWHRLIGYVPQAVYLKDDSIAANIAFGEDEIDKKRLQESIKAAQLIELINKLPQKAQTVVGERGIRLSGGERQRIAIARALYRNPDVIIFDEATSALDNKTEKELMKTIKEITKNYTVLMVAHRISTLKDCDRIFAFEKGSLHEVKYQEIKEEAE